MLCTFENTCWMISMVMKKKFWWLFAGTDSTCLEWASHWPTRHLCCHVTIARGCRSQHQLKAPSVLLRFTCEPDMYGCKKRKKNYKSVVKNENINSLGQEANTEEPDASEESWSSFSLLFTRHLHEVIELVLRIILILINSALVDT